MGEVRNDSLSPEEVAALETELRACLRHVPAPEGFSERVMRRVAERENIPAEQQNTFARQHAVRGGEKVLAWKMLHRPSVWWTAIAATLLLAIGSGDALHVHRQRQQRAAAEAQMDLAMQVTSRALAQVQGNLDRTPAGRYTQMLNELGK